jgi:metal-responsive CopG/Arc/MetJ family transcriptional regulator
MVRIEIHLDKTETDILDAIAKEDGRSRKNLCENEIRKLIKERGKKIKTANENVNTKH